MERNVERTPNDIPDLEVILNQNPTDTDTFSDNMDRLFAEDEKKSAPIFEESPILSSKLAEPSKLFDEKPPPAKSITYFTATAFWKNGTESVKVGVVLSKLSNDHQLYFLMCDASKRILEKLCVDDIEFRFSEDSLAVKLNKKEEEYSESPVEVKFVDRLTFLNFAITAMIRSSQQHSFKLTEGSGDVQIDKNCDIRYNLTKHSVDEDGQMKLPDERKGVKTRLSKEKLKEHIVYKWIDGCKKGCHFLIKDSENSIFEVVVDKIRRTSDAGYSSQTENSEAHVDSTPPPLEVQNLKIAENQKEEITMSHPEENIIAPNPLDETITPTPSSAPAVHPSPLSLTSSEQQIPSEDVRDALHRIVGIELDRIEMRLNAKFEKLQNDINSRLDRQGEMLQQLLEQSK
ncbi:hypothetical protein GCK72_000785 [Caenorhabditis remanei]|uniref:Uncharacterized protein n=1 Tax=Caenorhabditis remanei TaxID=31234 RepID=A0A6A5HT64_CAERE|nr:hypothetical protein GCK72_000785 [Caenorhabditis remanei]KAF1768972.1 hypothetical protein GCK72_000785 [Caenorhabditis remanei]